MALLNNRWSPRLDYRVFDRTPVDEIWSKMYDYPSCVAHGNSPDFTKEFSLLRTPDDALSLIRDAAKAAVRYALFEPRQLADLREC